MKSFIFTLVYQFPEALFKPQDLVEKLEIDGCTDAFTGFNDKKKVSLSFDIEASSMSQAILAARQSVSGEIPGAVFKELNVQEEAPADLD